MEIVWNERSKKPTGAALARALGKNKKHWDAIDEHVANGCEGLECEWKFYGAKHGWTYKVTRRKKAVLYMIPHGKTFTASMALREKAIEAARGSNLPRELVAEIEAAKAYPEGRPARIEVTSQKKVGIVKKLIAIKLEN
ncbi:MAG: DUF3788 domain-containing protein [bacterium]|nr:DUF3788 domain-containing protein [bacterium]